MIVTVDQLKSKRRTQDLARARQIAMYLAREMTGASLNQIGRAFGGRDHSDRFPRLSEDPEGHEDRSPFPGCRS